MAEDEIQSKQTVCIVDDNDDIRDIYGSKFQQEGFAVVLAKDGEEGLRVIRQEHPDVILLDIEMPILDGVGVLKVLKEDVHLAKIPVVILSNIDSDLMFQEIEAMGVAKYYLVKALTDPQKVVDKTIEALASNV